MNYFIRRLAASALVLVFLISTLTGCRRLMGVHEPRTVSDATSDEVAFLTLPRSASNIGFWDDGYQQEATFNIPEKDFRYVFPHLEFREIKEKTDYDVWSFGNPKNSPQLSRAAQSATAGLVYTETRKNGGGCKVVYDRNRQLCSYELVRW